MEIKNCLYCEKELDKERHLNGKKKAPSEYKRQKFCDRECMKRSFKGRQYTDNPSWYTAHKRARQIHSNEKCEKCGSTENVDIHHKDENWKNNEPSNLEALCRGCHISEHRSNTCVICGDKHKGHGYCNKHYIRFKKYGDPLYKKKGKVD